MDRQKHKCIFCLEESENFKTVEHIVSESLGNTDDILRDAVCDKCQNYLGKEVESFVLSKTPFAFWRTIYGTKTKQGKEPFFNIILDKKDKGAISNYHPFSDSNIVIHPAHFNNEYVIRADVSDMALLERIQSGQKRRFNIVLTPKMLVYMGRFLGKIALEYWCKNYGRNIFEKRFDELRHYVRYGTTNAMWPIFHWQLAEALLKYEDISDGLQEHTLYRYAYGEIKAINKLLFVFDIGSERYAIIMDEKYPDSDILTYEMFSKLFEDIAEFPDIFYYSQLK
ncbi:MAG: hypothetical protein VR67_17975 [Peptococcaceae bacterium BRH_c8a]|nr:MAG: hypothetical protein VR67_17975 [Peptococcaceae bacterium BRH_c8a]